MPRGHRIRVKLGGNNFNSVKVTADQKIIIILRMAGKLFVKIFLKALP